MRPFLMHNIVRTPGIVTINWSQFSDGLTGVQDKVRTVNRQYGFAGGLSAWVGVISGTDAFVNAVSDNGQSAGLITVSIDGAPPVVAPLDNNRYTLFSGLQHASRLVCITFGGAFYYTPYFRTDVNPTLTIMGYSPSVEMMNTWVQPGDNSTLVAWSAFLSNLPNQMPGYIPLQTPANTYLVSGGSTPSIRLKTNASKMVIVTSVQYTFVSVDGATPTMYTTTVTNGITRSVLITLDGNMHTYNVWQTQVNGNNAIFSVGTNAPLVDIGTKRRLDQYGDSITAGAGSLVIGAGMIDVQRAAAKLGMVGCAYGISGETVNGLLTRMPTLLVGKTVSSNDIAIIAEGRNNTGGSFSAQVIADYKSIINLLLAKGYGKVFCRGIIGSNVSTFNVYWPTENTSIQSIVTSVNDPRVIFVDTSGWPVTFNGSNGGVGIQLLDGTHPTDTGYVTMVPYATASYAPLI